MIILLIPMQLDDLLAIHDMLYLIMPTAYATSDMMSIRLRLTSKRLHAEMVAAGYRPGSSVVYCTETTGTQSIERYCSWTLSSVHIGAAIHIGLKHPDFFHSVFWHDLNPAWPFDYSNHWTFELTGCFTHLKPRSLVMISAVSTRLISAIHNALNYKRDWFISFLLSDAWNPKPLVNGHLLALEYALRHDDACLLAHALPISTPCMRETFDCAVAQNKFQVLQWFMENPSSLGIDTKQMQVRIMECYTVRIRDGSMDAGAPEFLLLMNCLHEGTRKRKAEDELVRSIDELKQARIESVK